MVSDISWFESVGSVSEYAITSSQNLSLKSSAISHVEAASLPAVAIAALQAFDRANNTITGGLAAKTVLVPAGLSGTGSIAVQLAKHVFRAGKVITTVSTSKVDKVDGFLVKGTVDQIVDYTKTTLLREVEKESVDFMFDTMGLTFACLPLMKPKTGLILSISTPPAGSKIVTHMPRTPFIIQRALDIVDCYYRWRVGRWNVGYDTFFGELKVSDLDRLSVFVIEGKLKPVVGLTAKLSDLQAVKDGCALVKSGKGGVGKFVIMID
jgi:NADPH:quinone reductase-like Zn-dependent oxidoreductase